MKVTSIGHESWLLEGGSTSVLVDPVLGQTFGTDSRKLFKVIPEREVDLSLFNQVTHVVYTTEYYQHFDIESLTKLESSPKVIVPNLFSNSALKILRETGLEVVVAEAGKMTPIDELEISYIPPSKEVVYWDSRVTSLALSMDTKQRSWCFFQSDTKINSKIQSFIHSGWQKIPSAIFVTNHKKFWDSSGHSANDNFVGPELDSVDPIQYVSFLASVVPAYVAPLNQAKTVFISGGGYDHILRPRPFPRINNNEIQSALQSFALNTSVYSPKPGDRYRVTDRCEQLPRQDKIRFLEKTENNFSEPFFMVSSFRDAKPNDEDELLLTRATEYLRKVLLFSDAGESLIFTSTYLDKPCDSKRFCLQLLSDISPRQYVFDLSIGEFVREEFHGDQALAIFPGGIRVFLSDFLAVLRGSTTIAEICHSGSIQWFVGDFKESPIGMLYTAFAEFMPNGLAELKYKRLRNSVKLG